MWGRVSRTLDATALREAFDAGFAHAARRDRPHTVDVLTLRVGGRPFAVRLDTLAGLAADRRVVRLPRTRAALLGVTGVRGVLVPVFSLPALLDLPAPADLRWIATVGDQPGTGFAFDALDGHHRVERSALLPSPAPRALQDGVLLLGAETVPLLDLVAAVSSALVPPTPEHPDV